MGGIRRGGGGSFPTMGVCQDRRIPLIVDNFISPLSCRLIRKSQFFYVPLWCNLFNRGGPSRLQPALYFYIRIPHLYVRICLLSKRLFLCLVTSNIIVIFVCDYYSLHNIPPHCIQTLLCTPLGVSVYDTEGSCRENV